MNAAEERCFQKKTGMCRKIQKAAAKTLYQLKENGSKIICEVSEKECRKGLETQDSCGI